MMSPVPHPLPSSLSMSFNFTVRTEQYSIKDLSTVILIYHECSEKVDEVLKMIKRFLVTECTAGSQSTHPTVFNHLYFLDFWIVGKGVSGTFCPACVNQGQCGTV